VRRIAGTTHATASAAHAFRLSLMSPDTIAFIAKNSAIPKSANSRAPRARPSFQRLATMKIVNAVAAIHPASAAASSTALWAYWM
jgi:hypothetical protein